jgi:thiol-disulfide isomerase/thioredoxin
MPFCISRWLLVSAMAGLTPLLGCGMPQNSSAKSAGDPKAAGSTSSVAADAKSSAAPSSGMPTTAQNVLEKMAAAYKNAASYEDFGTLEFRQDPNREQSETRANFSVAFQRPNKLHLELFNGRVVCDGKQWCAACQLVPGVAVLRAAPPKLSMEILRADYLLYSELSSHDQLASPPLQLLWENDPIPSLLAGAHDVTLDEPGRVGDYDCYRVRAILPEGPEYLWIDQKTYALRMMVVPLATGPSQPEGDGKADRVWLTMQFSRARLGGEIDPTAFKFDITKEVKTARVLVPAGPYELVGRNLPAFEFVDLQGKPWSSKSLAGKATVIHLWKSDVPEPDPMIPIVEQLHAKYKDNDKVAVLAVNLDSPDMPAKAIEDAARQLKLTVPLLRDNGVEARDRLKIMTLPTTLLVDAKGVLQDCIIGSLPVSAAAAPRKLEQVLAGEDLAKPALAEFQRQLGEIEKAVDLKFSGEVQSDTLTMPPTPMAARSEPAKLHFKPLWKCEAIGPAGNILVTQDPGGGPRIFVVQDFHSVSELSVDGRQIATYKPPLAKEEFFINLRSGAGRDGKRYFAAFAPVQQRFHLFDDKFAYLRSYPADALENRHDGLSDVALGDLNGDGVLKAYVGFAGAVGVKCVSLQGTQISSCRTLFNIGSVVPGPLNAQGQADLYCVNDFNSVAILDSKLQLRDAVRLSADGAVRCLTHADLDGSGKETWCGVMFVPDPQRTSGKFTAQGLDASGRAIWKYDLPAGLQQPVESVVVGRLLPGAARQWILPGSDGSIHVLAADGTLLDRFNYGEQVTGVATVDIGGKAVLLISSANGVEALRVE